MNQHRDDYLYETLDIPLGKRLKVTSLRPVTLEFYNEDFPFPQSGWLKIVDAEDLVSIVDPPSPGKWTIHVPFQGNHSPRTVLEIA